MFNVHSKRSRAFTFLEIMMVVVIVGILAGVVASRYGNSVEPSRQKATSLQIKSVSQSLEMFQMHVGRYPTEQEGLKALVELPAGLPDGAWEGPYLKSYKLPRDSWGRDIEYRAPGELAPDYDLISAGSDGQFGTEDDITNS